MFKITVTNNQGYIVAVQYNQDAEQGEAIARMQYGDEMTYRVEDTEWSTT